MLEKKMKIALITGGSRGLGKALLDVFSDNLFDVIEFSRSGVSSANVRCDFFNYSEASAIVEEKLKELSSRIITEVVLVNNVGTINPIGPTSYFPPSSYEESINVNFLSSIMVTSLFAKYFQNHQCDKTILHISSGAARKAKYGWSLYCGAKAGLEHFYKAFSLEQSGMANPIKVIVCDPGIIDTGMQKTIRESSEELFPEKNRFVNFKLNNDLVQPCDVAEAIFDVYKNTSEKYVKI